MKSELKKLKEKLWQLCKEITRARYGNTCYTCGRGNLSGSDWQTGHFFPKSTCSTELAYDLDNLRIQCSACNIWKSGNWPAFEEHLLKEKGKKWLEALKLRNRETKGRLYDKQWYVKKVAELQELIRKYETL